MNDKTYKILAWIGRIVLPALSVFYATVSKIWDLPYGMEIPATITAFDVLWNALLGKASADFFEDHDIVPATVDENVGQG